MQFSTLIQESKKRFFQQGQEVTSPISVTIFERGGNWMASHMQHNTQQRSENLQILGLVKYGLCLVAMVGSFTWLWHLEPWLSCLSVVVFYLVEIHFLFLFPLAIMGSPQPLRDSFLLTYRVGLLKALFFTMGIAAFMLFGLLNWRTPFKNWHIGCLAIVIWYEHVAIRK